MYTWDEVRRMVTTANTSAEKAEASRAVQEYINSNRANNNHLVTMQANGVTAVNLGNLGNEMVKNPSVFDRIKKMVSGK
jgi:isopentenyl diphosphate isomerase/L-lactate dehydrogenase-like FMN-dependent dehydrogenase